MATYKIIHKEELIGYFFVEANSEEEALEEFNFHVNNGQVDFSDVELVESSDKAVLEEE